MRYGAIHLHGHTHGNISREINYMDNRLDIGYDKIKEVLISFEEVKEVIITEKFKNKLKEI